MGLSMCTECLTVEGDWRQFRGSEAQMAAAGLDSDDWVEECAECGGQDCKRNIPEHDDGDLER